jgi:hypothetical protein
MSGGMVSSKYNAELDWLDITMIDRLIGNTLGMKQSPILYALGSIQNSASEDSDLGAEQVYITFIGKISPQALRSAAIGH